jgi:hypothetical protein
VVFYKEIVVIVLSPQCVVFYKEIVVIALSPECLVGDRAITAISLQTPHIQETAINKSYFFVKYHTFSRHYTKK